MRSNPSVADLYRRARTTGIPLVGGHRGNPAEHPENTLPSFRSAIELGVDMIECDVHLSSDGELVVIHDHTLDRTTNASGLVAQHTLAELRGLDAGGGEQLPALAEVVALAREAGIGLCVEAKQLPLPYPGLEERLVSLLRDAGMIAQACVISFDHRTVRRLKEIEPTLSVGVLLLARPIDPAGVMRAAGADIYAPHWSAMDTDLVAAVHGAGGVVGVWTVDDAPAIAWCQACTPDSVFTNRPREVVPALRP